VESHNLRAARRAGVRRDRQRGQENAAAHGEMRREKESRMEGGEGEEGSRAFMIDQEGASKGGAFMFVNVRSMFEFLELTVSRRPLLRPSPWLNL